MTQINIPEGLVLKAHGYECDPADLPEKAIAYLLQHGWSKSHTDSTAVNKEDMEGLTADQVKTMKADRMAKRNAAILAGEVGTRAGGPRLVGIDKMIQIVAMEEVVAWAASKGKKLPTGKGAAEKLRATIANYMANPARAEAVRVKAQARIDEQQQAIDALGDEDFDFDAAAE
jgi:hypothetical protein